MPQEAARTCWRSGAAALLSAYRCHSTQLLPIMTESTARWHTITREICAVRRLSALPTGGGLASTSSAKKTKTKAPAPAAAALGLTAVASAKRWAHRAQSVSAATRIQARLRGRATRRKRQIETNLGLTGSLQEAALIARIQASFRGRAARKEMANRERAAGIIIKCLRGRRDRLRAVALKLVSGGGVQNAASPELIVPRGTRPIEWTSTWRTNRGAARVVQGEGRAARLTTVGLTCWVCLDKQDPADDSLSAPEDARLVNGGCGCRGASSFAHLPCLVQMALAHPERWHQCPTCGQPWTGECARELERLRLQVQPEFERQAAWNLEPPTSESGGGRPRAPMRGATRGARRAVALGGEQLEYAPAGTTSPAATKLVQAARRRTMAASTRWLVLAHDALTDATVRVLRFRRDAGCYEVLQQAVEGGGPTKRLCEPEDLHLPPGTAVVVREPSDGGAELQGKIEVFDEESARYMVQLDDERGTVQRAARGLRALVPVS